MKIDLDLFPLLLLAALIFLLITLNRRYQFIEIWIKTIKRYAPLWLVFFPAMITYFFVCGSLSALVVVIYSNVTEHDGIDGEAFLLFEKGVEYLCSFFMPLLYFRLLEKHKFQSYWALIITVVHMLAAGYRDAKLVILEPSTTSTAHFESGPKILTEIQLLDALIPLVSYLVFLLLFQRKNQKNSSIATTGETRQ
jgi:hypothetical protein